MPNWCQNEWTITASSEAEAAEILALITHEPSEPGEPKLTFTKLLPRPEIFAKIVTGYSKIDGQDADRWVWDADGKARALTPEEEAACEATGHRDWHSWSCAIWGTKWDASSRSVEVDGDTIELRFYTAWTPPAGFLTALRERFPDAHVFAFYREDGVGMAGYL